MAKSAEAIVECCTNSVKTFEVGDIVDVKGHGRASVIEPLNQLPDSPHFGRYLVRYHEDDTTYWCRPKLMRRMYPTTKRILVVRSTAAYRDAIVHNVDRPDVCLEIGCHEGLTSNILSNRASFVTGVDTAAEVVDIARRRHPHLTFHQLDGLDVEATGALSPPGTTFNRICIDISGKAPLELICHMITTQRSAFPAASLIVKNEALFDALLLSRQHHHSGQQSHSQPQEQQRSHAQQERSQSQQEHRELQAQTHDTTPPRTDHAAVPLPPPPPLSAVTRDERMMLMRAAAAAAARQSQPPLVPPAAGSSSISCGAGRLPETVGTSSSTGETLGVAATQGRTTSNGPTTMSAVADTSAAAAAAAAAVPAGGGGGANAATEAGGAEVWQQRLQALLGAELVSDCEVFRHQSQPPRTRPLRRQGKA